MDDFRWVILALGGGIVGIGLNVPSGALIGPLVVVAAGNLLLETPSRMPNELFVAAQILIGAKIGSDITRGTMATLRDVLIPSLAMVLGLLIAGLLLAGALSRWSGIDPNTALYSTSPGAMTPIVAMTASTEGDVATVASLHILRIFVVTSTLPLLVKLLDR